VKFRNIIITTFSSLLLFNACATSNLDYNNGQIQAQVDNAQLHIQGSIVKQQRENFKTLFLTQNLLRLEDGSLLMYENAETDFQYQFEPTTTRSIRIIFDAKSIHKVYEESLFFAYQLVLQDNRILNIIVSQKYDQELKMVYGMSTSKFNSLLKKLDSNFAPVPYQNSIDLTNESNPFLSHWTDKKIHFYPLIVPIPRIGRL